MSRRSTNPFNARDALPIADGELVVYRLDALARDGVGHIHQLPYSIKVLLESALRHVDGFTVLEDHVRALANWDPSRPSQQEIPFKPARVVLQDFTGVPCLVDLAAMRDAMKRLGGDPRKINPLVPCDLVIDHSVQVDAFGSHVALTVNGEKEFARNRERYEFLKWGQQSLANFRVVPPATGIVHQVNLEYLASVVLCRDGVAFPDSCVGTDSHTTMINGLGVLGWGVGGIEAEAVMLGQPVYMVMPQVVGVRLTGRLREGATATDLVLTVTQLLRKHGVVDKFVEFFGPGLAVLSVPDRATIANMAPEYGATVGYFPVDRATIEYLRFTGRDETTLTRVEGYCKLNGLFWTPDADEPRFSSVVELDLAAVEPSLAGPRRPQDRVALGDVKRKWRDELEKGFGKPAAGAPASAGVEVRDNGRKFRMNHGDVVIAAITSCTNTSNPDVMIAAGLLARNARRAGLRPKPWVKTSLAPGSKVVTEYFDKAGLTADLEALGFHTVGYGCTTCIGNSGPLPEHVSRGIRDGDLVVAAVLSGNRNFEGRVHPEVRANYLASPPLVVAYALAGTVDIDLAAEPLGQTQDGRSVYLADIWPSQADVQKTRADCVTAQQFRTRYAQVFDGNPTWNAVPISRSELYPWNEQSTYIQSPPYFDGMTVEPPPVQPIQSARCLVMVGDSVTTDHISPAGDIAEESPAGQFLKAHGIAKADFNSYGSRRGNDRVMTRGTFANVRVKNKLAVDPATGKVREGGWTRCFAPGEADGPLMWIFDAAQQYRAEYTPLIILAGKDYGMGSSRDWAAKGVLLLGVRAVIAVSFERIHRSNLVGMGVLPLQFQPGQSCETLGLTGAEYFDLPGLTDDIRASQEIAVTARHPATGRSITFRTRCRIDTPVEVGYFRNRGVLQAVLRSLR